MCPLHLSTSQLEAYSVETHSNYIVNGNHRDVYLLMLYYYMRNLCNLIGLEQLNLKYIHVKITNLLRVVRTNPAIICLF